MVIYCDRVDNILGQLQIETGYLDMEIQMFSGAVRVLTIPTHNHILQHLYKL